MQKLKVFVVFLGFYSTGANANRLGAKLYEDPTSMALDSIKPNQILGMHTNGCSLVNTDEVSDKELQLECTYFLKQDKKFLVSITEITIDGTTVGAKQIATLYVKPGVVFCEYKGKEDGLESCVLTKEIMVKVINQKKSK